MKRLAAALRLAPVAAALVAPLEAKAAPPSPALAGIAFLLGYWHSSDGQVNETGGTAKGRSVITAEAGGGVLLRRDHTELFDKAGKAAGAFEQLMVIYPEAGTLHADYFDGAHTIHYTGATISPGKSVTFTSTSAPGAPLFKLTYTLNGANLGVSFGMIPPGQAGLRPIATGTLQKG